ncbi:MAG: trehalose-phosphatase [Ilumatobacter sp.]
MTNGSVDVTAEPGDVAVEIAALERPLLLVFDCDGVLAPLVDHADDSTLLPSVGDHLAALSTRRDVTIAILSGRSLDGLAQFDFADTIQVAGSYGGERRGADPAPLTQTERERLAVLDSIVSDAVELAGAGAWVERKPTSVVIHVREADRELGRQALSHARERQAALTGHECHEGSNVLELMARPTNKGHGLDALRIEFAPAATVYLGDDVPDEDAFARLSGHDLSIKVGHGDTIARRRLAGPSAVARLLGDLHSRL